MKFGTTSILLEELKPYLENADIDISSDQASDLVTVDGKNRVGFEVFHNEIIVFFFADHCHFEDYTSELEEGQENYFERAKSFLKELFQYKIRHVECYKGRALASEKFFVVYGDGREDECIGNTWFGLSRFINPFGKKTGRTTVWQFDKTKGFFAVRQPKAADPNAVAVIDISEDCYIEIFQRHNAYSYSITEMYFDDYSGYYWSSAANVIPSGLYDTKDSAITAAMEALKCRAALD